MYYITPDIDAYVALIKRYRKGIILFFMTLLALCAYFFNANIVISETQTWLSESKELQRTKSNDLRANFVSRLVVDVDDFNEKNKGYLVALQAQIAAQPGVEYVESIFSSHHVYNHSESEGSSLVKALPLAKLSVKQITDFVHAFSQPYRNYVNDDFSTFTYFIHADSSIRLESLDTPFKYHHYAFGEPEALNVYLPYALVALLAIVLLFRGLFHNYISIVSALLFIVMVEVFTFTLIGVVYPQASIHGAMGLLVMSIALVDFLYFYYRWHVSQYRADLDRALLKMVNRSIHPAFWTSFITIIGLGTLLFVDSNVIKVLSLSVIGASTIAYLLNITFLPALLSYFEVKHPKVAFGRMGYFFANREIHYNKTYLKLFLTMTFTVIAVGAYHLFFAQQELFAHHVKEDIIVVKTPYKELDLSTVEHLSAFEKTLREENAGVVKVESVSTILQILNQANYESEVINEQGLMQAVFFLQLYDMEQNLFDEGALNITIYLHDADKSSVIKWLKAYKGIDIYFSDIETLISNVKTNQTIVLGLSLGMALLIIGIIMGAIFQSMRMVLVGFVVNAVPIAWFGLFAEAAGITLQIEILIAMTITVGLASDATVHFAFKYLRSRYFGRTRKHSLEIMFFYAGVPVIIGSLVLASVFALLTQSGIHSLQLIGGYGAVLMVFSLLTDLFLLPVMLLSVDKERMNKKRQPLG